MKKLATCLVILSLAVFNIGCSGDPAADEFEDDDAAATETSGDAGATEGSATGAGETS